MPGNNFILSGEQKDPIGRRFPDTLTCGRYLHSTPVDPADNNFRPSEVPKNLAVSDFHFLRMRNEADMIRQCGASSDFS